MREIKFRAWTLGNDPLYYSKTPTMLDNEQLSSIGGYYYTFGVTEEKGYILMQYTGLKDKNDKEIYEGDIIVPWRKNGLGVAYRSKARSRVVKWVTSDGWGKGLQRTGFNLTNDVNCEVIGNIYENPELL